MNGWLDIDDAPRDGTWIILEVEAGGHLFAPRLGRFNPIGTPYDWETLDHSYGDDYDMDPPIIFTRYADAVGWMPLPIRP